MFVDRSLISTFWAHFVKNVSFDFISFSLSNSHVGSHTWTCFSTPSMPSLLSEAHFNEFFSHMCVSFAQLCASTTKCMAFFLFSRLTNPLRAQTIGNFRRLSQRNVWRESQMTKLVHWILKTSSLRFIEKWGPFMSRPGAYRKSSLFWKYFFYCQATFKSSRMY